MRIKSYVCYDKDGNKVKYLKEGKVHNAIYTVTKFDEIKDLMTISIYIQTEYIQELKWDKKTLDKQFNEWEYANTRKHYIHKIWK